MHEIHQTDNYIMSQQVLYKDSLNTSNRALFCSQLKNVPCHMFVKTLLHVVETIKALSHRSV